MDIAVCIKDTPASLEDVSVTDDGDLDEEYLSYNINEWDSSALEKAVQLTDENGGKVYAINMSTRKNEKMLRKCMARGADEAVLIHDEIFDKNDPWTSARILGNVLENLDLDLILTGLQSDDRNHSIVGGTLAELLNLPYAAFVIDLEFEGGSEEATATQLLEGGIERKIKIETPAVLAVETRIAEPNPPTMMAIRKTKGKEIDIRSLEDIGLKEEQVGEKGSKTYVKRYRKTPPPEAAEILEGGPEEVSQEVVNILTKEGLR